MTYLLLEPLEAGSLATTRRREQAVLEQLRKLGRVAVAFSGGVDSGLLAAMAVEAIGGNATAVTAVSESLATRELEACTALANRIGVRHELVRTDEVMDPRYAANTEARCYWCKDIVYRALGAHAVAHNLGALVDGMNADDTKEHRPGRRAAEALGVASPLFEAGLSKASVRALARARGLPVWDKPSMACLSSRVTPGEAVTAAKLARIEAAEEAITALGLRQVRVRVHGDLARIEVGPNEIESLIAHRDAVETALRTLGFAHVTVDLRGYGRTHAGQVEGQASEQESAG